MNQVATVIREAEERIKRLTRYYEGEERERLNQMLNLMWVTAVALERESERRNPHADE